MRLRLFRPAALGLAVVLAGCGGAGERKAEHLAKAIGFFEANNTEKAIVEFKNVLQIDPKTAKPYYYLGRIEEQKQNFPEAFGLYQKAVELDPNYRDAQFKLAQFFALSRQPDKAEEMLAPVAKDRPRDLEVRLMQVAIANLKGDTAGARAKLEAIVAEKPVQADPYLVLAAMAAQQSRPAEAENILKEGLAANPKSPVLLAALAHFYEQQKQWAQGEQALRDLIAAEPKQIQHRALLADAYARQNLWSEVETTLRTAGKDFPGETQPMLMLADFFARRGDEAKAEAELRAGVAAKPDSVELHSALAALLEKVRRPTEAEQVYRDFIARNETSPAAVKARDLLAEFLARQGRTAESEALADETLKDNPQDPQALLLKGKLALGRKNAQDAIAAFRSILKDQPDSAEVLVLIASAFQLDGKPALVQENLERAVRAKPGDIGPRRSLVQWLVQRNDLALALDQANEFLRLQPDSLEGLNLKADVLAVGKQSEPLEAVLKEIKAKFPDKPVGAYRLGNYYQVQGNYAAALAEYDSALQKAPNDYEILKASVTAGLEMKQPAKAEARLRKVLAENPKQAGAWQLLGALEFSQSREDEGVKALEKAIEANPQWLLPYAELGAWFQKRGDLERAAAVARKAIAAAPGDLSARTALANYLEQAKKPAEAEQVYRDFMAANEGRPEAAAARNLLTELLVRGGHGGDGSQLLDEALAKNPEDRGALLRKARLALSEKRPGDTVPLLEAALKARSDDVEALSLLAAAYQAQGRPDQARDRLEQAIRARPADVGLRRNLVQFLVRQNKRPEALAQAEDLLTALSGNIDAMNLKADVLAADKQTESLEALLKEIREKFPDQPMAAFRLGSFYQGQKKFVAALTEYEAAVQKSRNAYEPLRALVSVYLEEKQPAKADERLKKVLAENPRHGGALELLGLVRFSQNRPEEAVKSLNKAIEASPKWLPPYADLGAYYERQGQPDRAVAVYQKALAAVPGDAVMMVSLARVYEAAKQPDRAIAQYESLLEAQPDNLLAANNLATLLGADGDADHLRRALKLARRLENSGEPAFLDTLAWLYYLSGDLAKAQPIQGRVVEQAPSVPVFQYHLGMMYGKQGDTTKAREHLAKALEAGTDFSDAADARLALEKLQ
jgi:tetratricopeptide (TPR) repeat protein